MLDEDFTRWKSTLHRPSNGDPYNPVTTPSPWTYTISLYQLETNNLHNNLYSHRTK